MNVASLELCKELYELSQWRYDSGTNGFWYSDGMQGLVLATWVENSTPAYDLGYLLRKLPPYLEPIYSQTGSKAAGLKMYKSRVGYRFGYQHYPDLNVRESLPENAICKLAIELFKNGILTREDKERVSS